MNCRCKFVTWFRNRSRWFYCCGQWRCLIVFLGKFSVELLTCIFITIGSKWKCVFYAAYDIHYIYVVVFAPVLSTVKIDFIVVSWWTVYQGLRLIPRSKVDINGPVKELERDKDDNVSCWVTSDGKRHVGHRLHDNALVQKFRNKWFHHHKIHL